MLGAEASAFGLELLLRRSVDKGACLRIGGLFAVRAWRSQCIPPFTIAIEHVAPYITRGDTRKTERHQIPQAPGLRVR